MTDTTHTVKHIKVDLYYTAKRKKDYITLLAVSFFVMILVFELLLVTWLPFYLRKMTVWATESAREHMIEVYDNLRANLSSISKRHSGHEAKQIGLAYESLNQMANYLRKNIANLNGEQITALQNNLEGFEYLYQRMRTGKMKPEYVSIEPRKFMLAQAVANGILTGNEKIIEDEPEQVPEAEGKNKNSKKTSGKAKDEKRKTK